MKVLAFKQLVIVFVVSLILSMAVVAVVIDALPSTKSILRIVAEIGLLAFIALVSWKA